MATFFTDFSEYNPGDSLKDQNGWYAYKNTAPYSMLIADGGADGQVMRWTNTGSTNWNVLVWSFSANKANTVEILTKIRYGVLGGGTLPATMLGPHVNANADNTNAYRASFSSNGVWWHNAYWRDNALSFYASREDTTPRPQEGEAWWYRFRVERNTPQVGIDRTSLKYWIDGDNEPAGWLLQDDIPAVTDASLDCGIGAYSIAVGSQYDVIQFGVGTNGDDAPKGSLPGNPVVTFTTPTDITATTAGTVMSYENNADPTSNKEMWVIAQPDALPNPTAAQVKAGLGGDGNAAAYSASFQPGTVANPSVPVLAEGLPQSTLLRFWGVVREQAVDTLGSSDAFNTLSEAAGLVVTVVDGTGTPLPGGRIINYRVYSEARWDAKGAPNLEGSAATDGSGQVTIDTSGTFLSGDIVRLVTDEADGNPGVTDDRLGVSWQTVA